MDKVLEIIGIFANVIGIVSAIVAVIAWLRTRKHAENVNGTLEIIQNYRKVEIYTEVSKTIESIRTDIRAVSVSNRSSLNITKKYQEVEKVVRGVIQALPIKNNEMIEKMKEVERELREHGDRNEKIIEQKQTEVLDDLDYVSIQLKIIMENLRQGV